MLHTIRQIIGDDAMWRGILRGLNTTFWHQTVMGSQVEAYISGQAGTDLSKVFDQYLRDVRIPVLEYRIEGSVIAFRWADVVPGFDMPVRVRLSAAGFSVIQPTEAWQQAEFTLPNPQDFAVDPGYYVTTRDVTAPTRS
jgi:aminopeptidase N